MATGRYVFFIGADDYLGARGAGAAGRPRPTSYGSDVVLGKMVGVNGRYVHQAMYADGNRDDINLFDSALPWSLSNTKLFRRRADRAAPAALSRGAAGRQRPAVHPARRACAARRISVLADYECYYAVRRVDASNITYRHATGRGFLRDAASIMELRGGVDRRRAPRDAVLRRHFTWELAKLVGTISSLRPADQQEQVHEGSARWPTDTSTESIRDTHGGRRPGPGSALAQRGSAR